jgi:peptidyl-tRNA hydrolase, PTH1 family
MRLLYAPWSSVWAIPAAQYAGTRHNVGWEVMADALAASAGWIARPAEFDRLARDKFKALTLDGLVNGKKVMILKPTTFMNLSGQSVQAAMAFYQLEPRGIDGASG